MPEVGVEPTRGCPQRILSPPRLPFRHSGIQRLLLKNPVGAQVFFIISQTKPHHPYTPKNGIPALGDKHILLIVNRRSLSNCFPMRSQCSNFVVCIVLPDLDQPRDQRHFEDQ